jgi:hypothetical protein
VKSLDRMEMLRDLIRRNEKKVARLKAMLDRERK